MNNNELITKAKKGDENAISMLLMEYKPLVMKIARKYFLINAQFEDLVQEGMIGLFKAYRSFDLNSENNFNNYATLCIDRQIQNAIKSNNRNKNMPINTYFSINNQGKILLSIKQEDDNDDEDEKGFYISSSNLTPEESVIFKEKLSEVSKKIDKSLSLFEKKVLNLFILGMNYNEIALKLNREAKSIDNALNRIKIKLKEIKCI